MSPRSPGDGFPHLSLKRVFFPSDPHRSETAISRTSAGNTKMQFPGARGPAMEQNCYRAIPGIGSRILLGHDFFFRSDPHRPEIAIQWGLGPPWACGTWRNSGPGRQTRKRTFLVLGALFGGKSGRPKSFSSKVRNFFASHVSADRAPTCRKNREMPLSSSTLAEDSLCGTFG